MKYKVYAIDPNKFNQIENKFDIIVPELFNDVQLVLTIKKNYFSDGWFAVKFTNTKIRTRSYLEDISNSLEIINNLYNFWNEDQIQELLANSSLISDSDEF